MTSKIIIGAAVPLILVLAGCGGQAGDKSAEPKAGHAEEEGAVHLTAQQIAAAGIEIVRPIAGGAGRLTLPATIDSDPQATPEAQARHYATRAQTLGMDRGNSEL